MKVNIKISIDSNFGYIMIEALPNKWRLISSWWLYIVHIELPRLKRRYT